MAKVTPTIKSCHEILNLIDKYAYQRSWNGGRDLYVKTTFDPISTHALYGVKNNPSDVEHYKNKIKEIGGKYIRVLAAGCKDYRIICFALEITPEEALAEKMKKEKEERYQRALESKYVEIQTNIILENFGATNATAQRHFAHMLLNGDLDPLLPLESYVLMDEPTDKDEKRIFDIVRKANEGSIGCVGMVTNNRYKMTALADQMNKAITKEDKRARRHAACLKYGLNFLAKHFEKPIA